MSQPRIGITGAAGFVGSYLLAELIGRRAEDLKVVARDPDSLPQGHGLSIVRGSLESPSVCEEFLEGLDVVYHLAHKNSPVNSDQDQVADTHLNLIPSLTLLKSAAARGRKIHFVYFSTAGAMYSVQGERAPFQETDPPLPTSSYGIQKLAIENYLRLAASRGQLSATVLRIGNALGSLLPRYRRQGLVGVAVAAALENKPIRIFGSLENVRDYVHLRDVCSIAWAAREPRQPFALYNVGSGTGHSVGQVLELIQDCFGRQLQVERSEDGSLGLTDWVVLDIRKAERDFGWRPQVDLRSGIRELIASSVGSQTVSGKR